MSVVLAVTLSAILLQNAAAQPSRLADSFAGPRKTILPFPTGPLIEGQKLAIGDFDGDGYDDEAVASYTDLIVYRGYCDGSISESSRTTIQATAWGLKAADMDADGDLDLVLASRIGVEVLTNDGSANFSPSYQLVTNERHSDLVVEDFNLDGHLDFATPVYTRPDFFDGDPRLLFVFYGDGSGTHFNLQRFETEDPYPDKLASGDFDEDGRVDLVLTHCQAPQPCSPAIRTLMNRGAAGFAAPTLVTSNVDIMFFLGVDDRDGDGHQDLVIVSGLVEDDPICTACAHWFRGNGTGAFELAGSIQFHSVSFPPAFAASLDLNGDGRKDLIGSFLRSLQISLTAADGGFGPFQLIRGTTWPIDFGIMDAARDGVPDLVLLDLDQQAILPLGEDGLPSSPDSEQFPPFSASEINFLEQDFNGDGLKDIATLAQSATIYYRQPDGSFQTAPTTFTFQPGIGGSVRVLLDAAFGDYNNDGILDVVVPATHEYRIYFGSAPLTYALHQTLLFDCLSCSGGPVGPAADFDGDGDLDVLATGDFGVNPYIAILVNDGRGGFSYGPAFIPPCLEYHAVLAHDLNRDGLPDLIVGSNDFFYPSACTGPPMVYHNRGDGSFGPVQALPLARTPAYGLIDMDMDGQSEIVIPDQLSNTATLYDVDADGLLRERCFCRKLQGFNLKPSTWMEMAFKISSSWVKSLPIGAIWARLV